MNIAALEREEDELRSLPGLLAEAMGRTIEDVYKGNDEGVLADVELNRTITRHPGPPSVRWFAASLAATDA